MALAARVAVTRFKVSGLCSYGRGTNYSVCRFVELIHSDVNSHPEVGIGAHLVVVATCNLLLVYFGLQKITCLCWTSLCHRYVNIWSWPLTFRAISVFFDFVFRLGEPLCERCRLATQQIPYHSDTHWCRVDSQHRSRAKTDSSVRFVLCRWQFNFNVKSFDVCCENKSEMISRDCNVFRWDIVQIRPCRSAVDFTAVQWSPV